MNRAPRASRFRRQRGMSLIELMMALFVLAVGLAGAMVLVSTAIAGNNRNKLDTTATLLSQMVLEKILTPGNSNLPPNPALLPHYVTVTDCTGATFFIYLDPGGPALNAATGEINFAVPPPAIGYNMIYTVCKAGGQTAVYDVRWNIQALQTSVGGTIYTKLVTVAARPTGAAANRTTRILFFGLPITLRGVSGVSPN